MNVAIIGLGNIGFNYDKNKKKKFLSLSKSFYKSDFFKLKIGIDKKKKIRENFKKKYSSVKIFDKISSLKSEKIDLFVISTPTNEHYKCVNQILRYSKKPNLIIEKPISNKIKEFRKVFKILKSKKINTFLNYQRQSNPIFLKLKKNLKKSKETEILVKYSKGIYNNASHYLTYLLSVYGKAVKIIKTQNLKKNKNDYLVDFDLRCKECHIKFRYTKKKNQMVCSNDKISFLSNKDKIIFKFKKKNLYDKKRISKIFDCYQLHVIKNLENYFKKKKHNLCFLDKNYKTEEMINDIINYKNV